MSSTLADSTPAVLVVAPPNEVRWANQEAAHLFDVALSDLLSATDVLHEAQLEGSPSLPSIADLVASVRQTGCVRTRVSIEEDALDGVHSEWIVEGNATSGPDDEELVQLLFRAVSAPAGPVPIPAQDAETEEQLRLWKQYETIFENAQDALFLIEVEQDADGPTFTLLRLNSSHEALTGLDTEEVRGKSPHEFLSGETAADVEANYRRCVEEKTVISYDETLDLPAGTTMWHTKLSPVLIDGEVTHIVGISREISERKQAEDALRRRERYLAVTLDSIADAVVVTDTEGRVTRMNEVAETLTEWSAADAHHRPFSAVLDLRNAETREPVESPVEKVLENGETVGLANDTVLVGKDGTERQIADSAAPIRTEDGNVLGVVMVFRDVTEKYERRKALRASKERWRRLVEQSPEAIYVTVDWKLRYLNEAAVEVLGGDSTEELLGQSIIDFAPPGAEDEFEARRRKLEHRTATEPIERRMVRLDGEERIVVVQSVPIRYEGEPAVQTVIRDVTERRRLETQLRRAQRMETVGTLAGGIAHDFNNILHSAQAYLEIASQDLPVNHEVRPFLSRTEKGLHRAEELVKKLLTFSRQKSTKTRKRVDLAVLARDTLNLAEPSLPDDIEVRTHLEDGYLVIGDPGQLKQVLMNLVTNAGQAMEGLDGDTVLEVAVQSVKVDADLAKHHLTLDPGRYVCLTVSDTGTGMEKTTRERIFEPFFTTKDVDEGTGLGLSVVHGIVQSHGGDITVRSRHGRGTTFDVYLPSASETDGDSPTPSETTDDEPSRGHVLVVDDEEQVLEMETIRLQRFGYEVTTVPRSREALQAIESDPNGYDLVLTDYAMPDMSGLALTRTLRERGYDLPVVLMSGYSAQVSDAEVQDAGAATFLRKPVGTDELEAVLDELV